MAWDSLNYFVILKKIGGLCQLWEKSGIPGDGRTTMGPCRVLKK
jgi:hypothetical protein